jgi:hypothetical protein
MQHPFFETVIKNGYIKVPEKYSDFYDKKVVVEILEKVNHSQKKAERIKNIKEFLLECSGILKNSQISPDISMKQVKEMRLN